MLRRLLDFQLNLCAPGKPLEKIRPLFSAGDTFFYEAPHNTTKAPHIRDAIDLKRWMILVVFALLPCIFMAVWNTGVQKLVYSTGNFALLNEYFGASQSFEGYFNFVLKDNRWLSILEFGAMAFLPVMLISYMVGGLCEAFFACVRGHEIAEGFLVSGMLYPLILPPTIPYWMVAVGVAAGVVIGKELFGGTGMNILNPALTARAFLFFTFPNKMSGDVWVGTNPTTVRESLKTINSQGNLSDLDSITQGTPLGIFNISTDVKRVHVDAIASNTVGQDVSTYDVVQQQFSTWNTQGDATLGALTDVQMKSFVTSPIEMGGLALPPENYQEAYEFAGLQYGLAHHNDANFFFGNMLGSMGETSVLACLLGALFLIYTGVGAWRTMVSMGITAFVTAWLFQLGAEFLGSDGGAWNPAKFALPAYKHLLMGGLAFGLVFMATDPVSSAGMNRSKWFYGALIGFIAIIIRLINPAYPEGVMLAILFGNCFAPLFDYYAIRSYRRRRRVTA